jgi:hypothetical protein
LKETVAAPVKKLEIMAVGDPPGLLRDTPLSAKVGTYFADRRRSSVVVFRSRTQATEPGFVSVLFTEEHKMSILKCHKTKIMNVYDESFF